MKMKPEEIDHTELQQQAEDLLDKPSESGENKADGVMLEDRYHGFNFTWEHFFSEICGILQEDAIVYERNLIANRLSPLDVVFDISSPSYDMFIEYGQIVIGDKLKISKTISRERESIKKIEEELRQFKEKYDLKPDCSFEYIKMIHKLGNGDIRWGVEQLEEWNYQANEELDYSRVQNNQNPAYRDILRKVKQEHEPAKHFLRSFGYTSFEYTREKDIYQRPTQITTVEERSLVATIEKQLTKHEQGVKNESYENMYL